MTEKNENRIPIILLIDSLTGFTGGTARQIFELAKRLDKTQYQITIAGLAGEGEVLNEPVQAIGCELKIFPVNKIYGLTAFREGLRFFTYLKKQKTRILMTYRFRSDIWGTFWAKLAGVSTIISNRRDMGFWQNRWHYMTYQFINSWVTKIIVVAFSIKQKIMSDESIPADRIEIIYNGVDIPQQQPPGARAALRNQLGIPEDVRVIMHVADLKPIKGHVYLLRAIAEVSKRFPNLALILIGKDEQNGYLEKLAQRLNIKKFVKFFGKRNDVSELLSIADICVLPSLSEGMSNAVLEYMAHGKPVITTKVGGNPELVLDGYNGFVVEKEDESSLQKAILYLLQNPDVCARMGENGLTRAAETFSMTDMMNRYEKVFAELLQSHPAATRKTTS